MNVMSCCNIQCFMYFEWFCSVPFCACHGKLLLVLICPMRRYPQGIQQLVSTHQSPAQSPPNSSMRSSMGAGILGKHLPEVPKSSMRSSNSGGWGCILGKPLPKVPKSSMRSSNAGGWGWGVFLYQKYPNLCNFNKKILTLGQELNHR